MKNARIVIVVDGGVVQSVYSAHPLSISIMDCDDLKAGDGKSDDEISDMIKQAIKGLKEIY